MSSTPIIILTEPQMPENIGMVARAMGNMGLSRLRLIKPRDGWPNEKAFPPASGADDILHQAEVFPDFSSAIADCHFVIATTARQHAQAKPVMGPQQAAEQARARLHSGQNVAIVFGRERNGLEADEISHCHAILTLPVNPEFSSLNLAQAVLLVGYSWMLSVGEEGELIPYVTDLGSKPATSAELDSFFQHLLSALEQNNYFQPSHRRETMERNLRNIFLRQNLTHQDLQTLHGIVAGLLTEKKT